MLDVLFAAASDDVTLIQSEVQPVVFTLFMEKRLRYHAGIFYTVETCRVLSQYRISIS